MSNSRMQNDSLNHKVIKMIPLQILWTAGVPAVSWNPENETLTLTDNGAGDVTVTLASASLVPIKLMGAPAIQVADANTLSLEVNIDGAPTTTAIKFVFNSGADGATETDPVACDFTILKFVVA